MIMLARALTILEVSDQTFPLISMVTSRSFMLADKSIREDTHLKVRRLAYFVPPVPSVRLTLYTRAQQSFLVQGPNRRSR